MAYPISDVTRRVVYTGSAGVGPYSFTFEVLANTDIQVYKNTTLLTLTTNYTVTINANGTGSVTLVVAATGADNITIVGDRAIQRATDFVTGGDLFANTLNDEFDSLVIFSQQIDEKADRGLKAPVTDPTSVNMVLPVQASRASKYLAFDSNGNPVVSSGTGTTVVSSVMEPVVSAGSLSDARTNLGLASGATTTVASGATTTVGTMATQNASAVAITGGTIANVNLANTFGFKNRIINGLMVLDQRNAGASQTFTAGGALAYAVDRWYGFCTGANVTGQQVAGSTTPTNTQFRYRFTGAASVTAIGFGQRIEQNNSYDLAGSTATLSADLAISATLTTVTWTASYATTTADTFGTLASPTVTQIATGTFTVTSTVTNFNAQITVPAAATTGIQIVFTVGALTAGLTWTVGNVQLEKGSTATSFDYRSFGTELALCQRYFEKTFPTNTAVAQAAGFAGALLSIVPQGDSLIYNNFIFASEKRTTPIITNYNPTQANGVYRTISNSGDSSALTYPITNGTRTVCWYAGSGASQNPYAIHATASAEL